MVLTDEQKISRSDALGKIVTDQLKTTKDCASKASATVAEYVRDYFEKCRQELAKQEHQLLREVALRSMAAEEDLRAQLRRVEELKDIVETRASELKSDTRLSLRGRMQKYERIANDINAQRSEKFGAREEDLFSTQYTQYKLLDATRTVGRLLLAPTPDYSSSLQRGVFAERRFWNTVCGWIVSDLFPPSDNEWETITAEANVDLITEEEVKEAPQSMKSGRSPGLDGIPPEAIKIVANTSSEWLIAILNKLLRLQELPELWKVVKIALILKAGKPPQLTSSYRPLCMLNTLSKLLETLIRNRLQKELDEVGGLHPRQYGFTKGKSTLQALEDIIETAKEYENMWN
ncbi:uncharacterized protein LOC132702371 [Cylas formicarius]|uniref:uncharacterized protein LOC132702371 n=1 Tax=Cylas formicarius TaxID=197179 RepID=UPI00295841ED|nr:uncharacterized protein LOC132702371 [Cylas formicarius]